MLIQDYILNRAGFGEVGEQLATCRFDTGLLRPYLDERGRALVTVNSGRYDSDGKPILKTEYFKKYVDAGIVENASTSLRKDEWIMLDQAIIRAARPRLRAWADLAASNSFGGFDGMAKMILEHETMNDPGTAVVDFDGMTPGRTDSPRYQLEGLPLPITHSDFWFSSRRLAQSRNSGTPLDATMAEVAGRRVAETIEKTLIGIIGGPIYGDSTHYGNDGASAETARVPKVYGYTNFPARITKSDLTVPDGTNPEATLADVLEMRELLYDNNFYGPYMLYHSTDWDKFLDNDYFVDGTGMGVSSGTSKTLRNRLRDIEGVADVRRLDFLDKATNPFTLLMVQMTSEVARAVMGMGFTTVQWESMGGMRRNFKVMTIQVPQLRADFYGKTGILHAITS